MTNLKNVLKKLMFSESIESTQLNEDETLEIEQLIERGIVRMEKEKYFLTPFGLKEMSSLQDGEFEKVNQPLIATFAVVTKGDKVLINRRTKQPFMGYHGFPGGKFEFGELFLQSIKRELFEETGLVAESGRLSAITSIRTFDDEEISGHNLMVFFHVERFEGDLIEKTVEGENFWIKLNEVEKLSPLYPDVMDVLKAIENKKPLFLEMKRIKFGDKISAERNYLR